MSKRLQVLGAVKAMLEQTWTGITVLGLDANDVKPDRIGDQGLGWIEPGDPGEPDIDLSPPTYHYEHDIPVQLAFYQRIGETAQQTLDAQLMLLGTAIATDRTLGGLCDYLDTSAPTFGETEKRGATVLTWADLVLTASYSTTSPLG